MTALRKPFPRASLPLAGALCAAAFLLGAAGALADDEDVGVATGGLSIGPSANKPGTARYRLVLKDGNRYLDHGCSTALILKPMNGRRAKEPCQLWQLDRVDGNWFRLRTAEGRYLNATGCSAAIGLAGKSEANKGACQVWHLYGNEGGWSRLQLKHNNQYLDATYCKEQVALNPGSDWAGGACQQWRLMRE